MAPVRFHILVVNVDVIKLLLLFENLLCSALKKTNTCKHVHIQEIIFHRLEMVVD